MKWLVEGAMYCASQVGIGIVGGSSFAESGVWSWGSNLYGQLGAGYESSAAPKQVTSDFGGKKVAVIQCGVRHSAAVTGTSATTTLTITQRTFVLMFGAITGVVCKTFVLSLTFPDQCGIPGSETYRKPKLVKQLQSLQVLMVACGASHTVFLVRGE